MKIISMEDKIHLIGIGEVPAKKAKDFKTGDIIMWNYGHLSRVEGIEKETKTQIIFKLSSGANEDNLYYKSTRRVGRERLLAIKK